MGVLKDATRQVSATDSKEGSLGIGTASTGAGLSGSRGSETALIKNYDTSWVPPLLLLKKLQDNGLIQTDISKANIGQVVEFRGLLSITDMSLVKSLSAASSHMNFGGDAQAGIEIVNSMPPSVQGIMKRGNKQAWFLGNSENWVAHPNALMLSYGSTIGTGWKVIGILQSKPSKANKNTEKDAGSIPEGMRKYADTIKELMGKPDQAYGITPLIILRPVN